MPRTRSPVSLAGGPGLDPDAPVPLHRQLRDRIAASLFEQSVAPGAMLPGEHALCHDFGVSRTVVRQALAHLEAEGLVDRVKGKGTFVARPRTPEGLAHTLTGLYEEATARGSTVHSVVRRLEWVEPDPTVAEALATPEGGQVLLLERLRLVDGEPWSLTTTWLPARLAAAVLTADLTSSSLYLLLREHGVSAQSGVRSVDAAVADPLLAELLGLRPGDPLLVLRSLSFDQHGEPMEVFSAYHRGDRSSFAFHLRTTAPQPGTGLQGTINDVLTVELPSIQPVPLAGAPAILSARSGG